MPIKTLFIGSNWEALKTIKALHNDIRFDIIGCITQPDKPVGRKKIVEISKIKKWCIDNDIKVFHTEDKKEKYKEALNIFNPELIVCKSFGEILPKFFLNYPKYKSINVHYSLLPKYRGAVPIQKAILEGDKETGISIVIMTRKIDNGDILAQFKEKILPHDTNLSLRERLVQKTCDQLGDVLWNWCNNKINPKKQDNNEASYCYQRDISKENAYIDMKAEDPLIIDRKVRAFIPWPIAWTIFEGKRLKIYKTIIVNNPNTFEKESEYWALYNKHLYIKSCKDKTVEILELQPEGKNIMSAQEFINGFLN